MTLATTCLYINVTRLYIRENGDQDKVQDEVMIMENSSLYIKEMTLALH